jgi:hypothetical protein
MSCSWVQGLCFLVNFTKPSKNSVFFFIFSVRIFQLFSLVFSRCFFKNQKFVEKLFLQHLMKGEFFDGPLSSRIHEGCKYYF